MSTPDKPITSTTIPGTKVPDVTQAEGEDAAAKSFMSKVAITTAILATLASIASMFSGSHLNQAMISQIQKANEWSHFQAKGIKQDIVESRMATVKQLVPDRPVSEADAGEFARYTKDKEEISARAQAADAAATDHLRRHVTLGKSSTAYQIAIALAAVALLSKRASLWYGSIALGLVGSVFFAIGML